MKIKDGTFHYAMSILKSNNGNPESCNRFTYTYENPIAGEGRFIHTYINDDNKVSLFVRYIDIATGEYETRIVNKNK